MDFSDDDLANFSKTMEDSVNFEDFSRAMQDLPATTDWDVILSASQRNDVSVATANRRAANATNAPALRRC